MKCALATCINIIPKNRKISAKFCSDACYYEAKKNRSRTRYAQLKAPGDEIKKCEQILAYLYGVASLKKSLTADDLTAYQFNFGISTGERLDDKKRLCKIIGGYSYYIDSTKKLEIWKLKQSK
jgi:hypothetical protein